MTVHVFQTSGLFEKPISKVKFIYLWSHILFVYSTSFHLVKIFQYGPTETMPTSIFTFAKTVKVSIKSFELFWGINEVEIISHLPEISQGLDEQVMVLDQFSMRILKIIKLGFLGHLLQLEVSIDGLVEESLVLGHTRLLVHDLRVGICW